LRDSVLLNAGVALWIAGVVEDVSCGVLRARETLESGAVEQWLQRVRAFYQ
jgi:anthranilate phosphoribosyltransferase